MRAKLAFVVPAFNAEATLGETVASIMAQDDPDWQAVIVDDGSTDGTAAVARRFCDGRITLVRQRNSGLSAARNTGLAEVRAEWVTFLDADDVVTPEFVGEMARAGEGFDLVACATSMVGPGLEDLGWTIEPAADDCSVRRLMDTNSFPVGSVAVHVNAARRLGMVRGGLFDTSLPCVEDWDAWIRLTMAGARWARVAPAAMFRYRLRPQSMSTNVRLMHRTGLEVISRAAGSNAGQLRRRWTLRQACRAIAAGDAALVRELLVEAGGIRTDDAGLLAGALRTAFCMHEAVGPGQVDDAREDRWRRSIAAVLGTGEAVDEVLARAHWDGGLMEAAAEAIVRRLGARETVVLYGMGRRGRALAEALRSLGLIKRVAWVDDAQDARGPEGATRLRLDSLTDRHVIVVTAQEGEGIATRLRASGLTRWWTIEDLAHARAAVRIG